MYSGDKKRTSSQEYPAQSNDSFESINRLILKHLEDRDWLGNPPRGLATSISLEASELLEHYQWSDSPVGGKQGISEELADIFIYAFEFAQANDIDIVEAIQAKLEKAGQKYPAEDFKGKAGDERREAWMQAKLRHQKKGL